MTVRTRIMNLTATTVALALAMSACGGGDAGSGGPNNGDSSVIETSPESTFGVDEGTGADNDMSAEDLQGEGGGIVTLGGAEYDFTLTCTRQAADVDLLVTGRAPTGMMSAAFGADDPSELVTIVIDGVSWTATSGQDSSDFTSLEVDVDAGTVVGEADFLAEGQTESGSFTFSCP